MYPSKIKEIHERKFTLMEYKSSKDHFQSREQMSSNMNKNPSNAHNINPNFFNPLYESQRGYHSDDSSPNRNIDQFQRYRQDESNFGKIRTHHDHDEMSNERYRSSLNLPKKKLINAEVRMNILPKSPLMVLTELVGYIPFNVIENSQNECEEKAYIACCEIEEEIFSGKGPTKFIAKNICAEHAIKGITIKRHEIASKISKNGQVNPVKDHVEEENAAWRGLACIGLFKMFNDWSAEGFEVPEWFFKPPDDISTASKVPIRNKKHIPKNPTDHHPVSLLTMMYGTADYVDMGCVGEGMIKMFTIQVELDSGTASAKTYTGQGRTKKEAKKNCALNALKGKYDIDYPPGLYPS